MSQEETEKLVINALTVLGQSEVYYVVTKSLNKHMLFTICKRFNMLVELNTNLSYWYFSLYFFFQFFIYENILNKENLEKN